MNLENQVCSLELAQKLKSLGVKQESLFWWSEHTDPPTLWNEWDLEEQTGTIGHERYSAFTVAELITQLQSVAKEDIVVAWSDDRIADHLAEQLCIKLQEKKGNVGSGLTH